MLSVNHCNGVIMSAMASQITSLTIVYSTVYSGTDQRKHQNSASLAFVRGIRRGPVNSSHKGPVTRKMFPFDDVIMRAGNLFRSQSIGHIHYRQSTYLCVESIFNKLHHKLIMILLFSSFYEDRNETISQGTVEMKLIQGSGVRSRLFDQAIRIQGTPKSGP